MFTKDVTESFDGLLSTMICEFVYNDELTMPIRDNQVCLP